MVTNRDITDVVQIVGENKKPQRGEGGGQGKQVKGGRVQRGFA